VLEHSRVLGITEERVRRQSKRKMYTWYKTLLEKCSNYEQHKKLCKKMAQAHSLHLPMIDLVYFLYKP
jgi:hypothetical protein